MTMSLKVTIFTDGSSRGNPGPGGWGAIVVQEENKNANEESQVTELGGGEKQTTNNRMEINAAAEGIAHAPKDARIEVFTDSKYLINGITSWIKGWKRNGWQTKTKEDVMNKDHWMKLDDVMQGKTIKWTYVGGHIGILGNERCDHIATAFADGMKISLYKGALAAYDLPNILDISFDELKAKAKKSSSSKSNAKAYSYVSSVGGVIEVHKTWAECEKRVKGAKGARYKKSVSSENETEIISEFGAF